MRNFTRVLGIDQSLTCTGWCIVDFLKSKKGLRVKKYGIIEPKKLRGAERLIFGKKLMEGIIERYKPNKACMEEYAYERKKVMAPYNIGEWGGVIKVILGENNIPFEDVNPSTLKKMITGYGRASKEQMISAAKELSGIKFGQVRDVKRNDAADGFCMAYVYAIRHGYIE